MEFSPMKQSKLKDHCYYQVALNFPENEMTYYFSQILASQFGYLLIHSSDLLLCFLL